MFGSARGSDLSFRGLQQTCLGQREGQIYLSGVSSRHVWVSERVRSIFPGSPADMFGSARGSDLSFRGLQQTCLGQREGQIYLSGVSSRHVWVSERVRSIFPGSPADMFGSARRSDLSFQQTCLGQREGQIYLSGSVNETLPRCIFRHRRNKQST